MIINHHGKIEVDEIETQLNISEPLIRVYATTTGADLFLNGIDNKIEENLIKILVNNNLTKFDIENTLDNTKKGIKRINTTSN